jgi:hypothetical protein
MNLPFDIAVQPKENIDREAKEHINDVIDKLKRTKQIATKNVSQHQEKKNLA